MDGFHQGLTLPHEWGVRDVVSVIKVPKAQNTAI